MEVYAEQLVALTDEMRSRTEWPAKPGKHCRWCQFNHVCPAVDTVAPEDLDTTDGAF